MKKLFTQLLTFLLLSGIIIYQMPAYSQTTDTLMYEEFNYPIGELPAEWVLDGQAEWKVSESQMGGGTVPELYLGYSFASGLSRLISPVIDITGHQDLKLTLKQYLVNYEADAGEVIGIDVTFDGGATWQTLWQKLIGVISIPPDTFEYYFKAPDNATQVQYAFRFDGNNNFINMWLIDDVTIETVAQNDLIATTLSGTITPTEGTESTYNVEVLNAGSLTQSDYTVKLMNENGVELATAQGLPILFAEKLVYEMKWTPAVGEAGNTSIYAVVEFPQDEIVANNSTDSLDLIIQTDNIASVQIGDEFVPVNFMPYNYFNFYSFTQTLYFPDEIGMSGDTIIALGYTGQFDQDTKGVHLHIMLGETTNTNLTEAWLDPSTLTPVFDGIMDFKKGLNAFYIPLDNSYKYNGGNLVVQSVKNYEHQLFLTPTICTFDSASQRSRAAEQDMAAYDPQVVPEWGYSIDYYPNLTIYFATDPNGINDVISANVNLYPNPASSELYVQSDVVIKEIRLINTIGQVVYQKPVGANYYEINVSDLNQGIYVVQMITDKGIIVRKASVK